MEKEVTHTRFLPLKLSLQKIVAHVYFFFNSLGLKGGLLYTNILTPFLIYWIFRKRQLKLLFYAILVLIPFSLIHYQQGVDLKTFALSHALFISTIIFVICVYIYCSQYASLKTVLKQILVLNFILVLIAIPFYFAPLPYQKLFWYTNLFTGQKLYTRLALFTFEASYYALLMIPICTYYFFKHAFNEQFVKGKYELLMAFLPILLSMSFGVIGALIISACLLCWWFRKSIVHYKIPVLIITSLVLITFVALILLVLLSPDNMLVQRIGNIFSGEDTSTNGRTFESFAIGWKVAQLKSIWFGCGLGQVKLLMPEVVMQFFSHWGKDNAYRIPNTVAETLAIFGIFGLIVRFGFIFYFFIKTKVYTNYFRLTLFLFVFIYQFTGSYVTNSVEYVIWVLAFTNVFPEFNRRQPNHNLPNV